MQQRIEDYLGADWEKAKAAISAIQAEIYKLAETDLRDLTKQFAAWMSAVAQAPVQIRAFVDEVTSAVKMLGYTFGLIIAHFTLFAGGAWLGKFLKDLCPYLISISVIYV